MTTAGNIAAICSKSFSRNISGCGGAGPPPGLIPKNQVMEKIFIKCYVAGKKDGIICDGEQVVIGN